MNSLAVFKGGAYTYIDHPGTPVEEIGTAILGLTYPFVADKPGGFTFFHLQNPAVFLNAAHEFLIIFNLLCVATFFLIAFRVIQWNRIIGAAALALMYFAIHSGSLSTTMIWNHNSVQFPFWDIAFAVLLSKPEQGIFSTGTRYKAPDHLGILFRRPSFCHHLHGWLDTRNSDGDFVFYWLQSLPWKKTILAILITGAASAIGFLFANLPIIDRLIGFGTGLIAS